MAKKINPKVFSTAHNIVRAKELSDKYNRGLIKNLTSAGIDPAVAKVMVKQGVYKGGKVK